MRFKTLYYRIFMAFVVRYSNVMKQQFVNVGSLETRSNQLKYQEQKSRSPKITTKLITGLEFQFH